jgi:hypothetical protein
VSDPDASVVLRAQHIPASQGVFVVEELKRVAGSVRDIDQQRSCSRRSAATIQQTAAAIGGGHAVDGLQPQQAFSAVAGAPLRLGFVVRHARTDRQDLVD